MLSEKLVVQQILVADNRQLLNMYITQFHVFALEYTIEDKFVILLRTVVSVQIISYY